MRAVVQRVLRAWVEVDSTTAGAIEKGLLVYLGVGVDDSEKDAASLAEKIRHVRIFDDESGKLNLDIAQAGGSVLAVSAFTVQADARKGRRPTFEGAARGEKAARLYAVFCDSLRAQSLGVAQGVFGGYMQVHSVNDGPICILLDSQRKF